MTNVAACTHSARCTTVTPDVSARSYNHHETSRYRLIRCYTREMTAQSVLLNSESATREGVDKNGNSGSANQRFESSLPSQLPHFPYGKRHLEFLRVSTALWKRGQLITRSVDAVHWLWRKPR